MAASQGGVNSLFDWFAATNPQTVDLVGDIAGREPFIIHGESLLRYCLAESRVDFENGFQVLHAVYAVEKFLSNLYKRGCDFDIVFFRNLRHVCVPAIVPVPGRNPAKYQLARTVIMRHLDRHARRCAESGTRAAVLEFASPEAKEFVDYLMALPIHFIFCHDGGDGDDKDAIQLRLMMYNFVSMGKNVAIINSIEWKSSKVYAPLIGRSSTALPPILVEEEFDTPQTPLFELDEMSFSVLQTDQAKLSARELLGVLACYVITTTREASHASLHDDRLHEVIQAYFLHLAVLKNCTLLERQDWIDPSGSVVNSEDAGLFLQIVETSFCLLDNRELFDAKLKNADWDLFDPMDGYVFQSVLRRLRDKAPFPLPVVETWKFLCSTFSLVTGSIIPFQNLLQVEALDHEISSALSRVDRASALPFSQAILDEFLDDIKLTERKETRDEAADLVFRDLFHWHNSTRLIPNRRHLPKITWFARKRNQKRLADIVTYSASLTNSRGKLIDPEIIVVKQAPTTKARKGKTLQNDEAKPTPKHKGHAQKKTGGRAEALKAAQEVQKRKGLAKNANIVTYWDITCRDIEKDSSLVNQYLKTTKFLFERSKDDLQIIGPDIQLYLCHILGKIWSNQKDTHPGLYLIAMTWNWLQQMPATGASKAVVKAMEELTHSLKLPTVPISLGSQTHPLCFDFYHKSIKSVPKFIKCPQTFQLQHCGPYMERRFDSRPDDRVPFDPDAWQRRVLDSIDADNSILVIAPTSAGKTFISFYAMKKVLEESDDGVLVYVAPTKALVNQIAAEIGARYTKSYDKQEGKSVWAIYTRDYRIQNPAGCQVLVTVPHILQIMLLAPTNAKGQNAWSRRIKRIIFDEVHCIGQTEDGVVWEQLLLMAPCPIIALSATVGNPDEFRDWLALVQERKGLKLDMVVHTARYSDLRKFIYKPSQLPAFTGFNHRKRVSVPGLDEGDSSCPRFCFVHPVTTLTDRNYTALKDISLEPRDCLSLLNAMKQVMSKEDLSKFDVPQLAFLPDLIAKSDVIQWEAKLKSALRRIMEEAQSSTFHKICDKLKPSLLGDKRYHDDKTAKTASLFDLVRDLHGQDSLPALVFHYDIHGCENTVKIFLAKLKKAEMQWKSTSPEWAQKMEEYDLWKKSKDKCSSKVKVAASRSKDASGDDSKSLNSRFEQMRAEANIESSPWERFDPDAPLEQFSLADATKLLPSEVEELIQPLEERGLHTWLLDALRRGLGVHHSGMNRQYRQTVEVMFRKGYLRLVVATGTLALGINMPCKTVVFHDDSIFLTAQNYQQAAGRAGRRGFDLLGNVVFHWIPRDRVYEIMSARLPGLNGQFPLSCSLVLRLLTLLHGSDNCKFAATMVQSLLSQTRLYLGGPEAELAVKHHLRFSIEYLRRQRLLKADGAPINFAGLVGHLYFTENGVFAFHSLLKGGYFHQLCSRIKVNPERVLLELMLVLCHIFNREPIRLRTILSERVHRSSSIVFLPRLPRQAERLLIQHNEETLSIFHTYVQSYISSSLASERDRILPYTQTQVGQEKPLGAGLSAEEATHMVRSPFVALSGLTDQFASIHDLCETVRSDVFLEESAIPYIPVWPHDSDNELNTYIYDFFKHGSLQVLIRDNGIKNGHVWFLLKDFSRTLAAIVASIETLIHGEESTTQDALTNLTSSIDESSAQDSDNEQPPPLTAQKTEGAKTKKNKNIVEDWRQECEDNTSQDSSSPPSSSASSGDDQDSDSSDMSSTAWQKGKGLLNVLEAFTMLKMEFDEKFRKIGS